MLVISFASESKASCFSALVQVDKEIDLAKLVPMAPHTEFGRREVSEQLNRILASAAFLNSLILQAFLRFITTRALDADDAAVSEHAIAIQVFGKDVNFDSATDTTVRTQAYRLRQKLKEYYAGQGSGDAIIIDIPKGHYRPSFSRRAANVGCASPEPVYVEPPSLQRTGTSRGLLVPAVLLGVLVLAVGIWIGRRTAPTHRQETEFGVSTQKDFIAKFRTSVERDELGW